MTGVDPAAVDPAGVDPAAVDPAAVDPAAVDPQLRMARDIADQFRHLPPEQAADAVADHVRAFWDPRMRAALLFRVREGADSIDHPIDPVVAAAASRLG